MALVGSISGSSQSNSVIGVSGSVIVANRPAASFPQMPGTDVTFFVSGSTDGTAKSSFGGDVTVTGSLAVQSTLNVKGSANIEGDLTVLGTTSTIDTTNLEVRDAVIGLGFSSGTIAVSANDRGIIGGIAGGDNVALLWKNSQSEFALGRTASSATGSLPVSLTGYSNLHVANVQANIVTASLGFSGSLTKLADGTSYLIAGNNVTITSASNGAVTVSSAMANSYFSSTTPGAIYTTGSTAFAGGSGITSPSTVGSDVFFFVSGSKSSIGGATPGVAAFGGDVVVSGSLQISGSSEFFGDTLELSGSLLVSGNASINGNLSANNVYAQVVTASLGLSGSLTKLTDGTSYLIAGANVTITSASNGAVTVSAASTSPASPANSVQFNNAGTFGGSANFSFYNGSNTLALTGTLGMKGDVIPDADFTYNLGTSTQRWQNVYTGDLHLRNDKGDWTIVEERDYLCVVNNITGKKYKMMLQDIDE